MFQVKKNDKTTDMAFQKQPLFHFENRLKTKTNNLDDLQKHHPKQKAMQNTIENWKTPHKTGQEPTNPTN